MPTPEIEARFAAAFAADSELTLAEATQVWTAVHRKFTAGVSGTVNVFVRGAWEGSLFGGVEFPGLLANPNVTEVVFRSGE